MRKKRSARHAKSSKAFALVVGLLLCLGIAIPSTIAYLADKTADVTNTFTPSKVECEVSETFDGSTKSSIKVLNKGGEEYIEAYIRVRLVTYRQNAAGQAIGGETNLDGLVITDSWFKQGEYYYCKTPVAAGALTAELLSNPYTLKDYEDGESQVVEVLAEAIQSKPTTTVTSVWGVTVDSNGNLTN